MSYVTMPAGKEKYMQIEITEENTKKKFIPARFLVGSPAPEWY